MGIREKALALHKKLHGKISIESKAKVKNLRDLDLLYTPGVADVSREIAKNKELAYEYTSKWNTIAIVSDGTRVLGLGDIGPEAAMPVMEGKAILLKIFGGVDAFPICLATKDAEQIIQTEKAISPSFGGINLEDIQSPKVFEIEKRLTAELDIPVFHDDQHGTATVVLAALINAFKVTGKKFESAKIVIAGAGAAGIGIARLLHAYGAQNIFLADSRGLLYRGREEGMNPFKEEALKFTNRGNFRGTLSDALDKADVFIGVSGKPNLVSVSDLEKMDKNAIVLPISNPTPEIFPEEIKKAKNVKIIGTGRSDFPNQINNSLVFPAMFRGVLDARVRKVTEKMKIVAAEALAGYIPDKKLKPDYIIPRMTDKGVFKKVSKAVFAEAKREIQN